ncbi:hypothetical protein [Oleiharenicola lentus]|uniref:hypothetical protein n=1 Tax=Oleiharenicola lentus TaxID=2508720 RepID=UPI003F66F8FD
MNPKTQAYRFSAPHTFGVDRNAGILTNVALITADLEAKGHGIYIDEKTISTANDVLAAKGAKFKAAISHLSWADQWMGDNDRVTEFPGWFSGVAVKGNQLVAARLEFYDTFKTDQPKLFSRILEMAEKTPDLFGISLEPWGYLVFVAKDGTEYSERPKDVELKYDGMPALRCTELTYGAIVDDPAANPGGIFAALSRGKQSFKEFLRGLFADEQQGVGLPKTEPDKNTVTPSAFSNSSETQSDSAMKETHTKIKAAFGADKAKFSRAMTILGDEPEITFEALSAKMHTVEISELQATIGNLTTERTNLSTQVTNLTAERDDWKKKFDELKASGLGGKGVDLGAGNGGGAANEPNPWDQKSLNATRQAEITLADPKRAEALKVAAGVKS